MSVTLTPEHLHGMTVAFAGSLKKTAGRAASKRAAIRSLPILKKVTPVDTALTKRAWHVRATSKGHEVQNDSPYIGILERGARPHWPPWEPIVRWVARQQKVSMSGMDLSKYGRIIPMGRRRMTDRRKKVERMAFGLCKRIASEPTPPKHFIRKVLPKLSKIWAAEVKREMSKALKAAALGSLAIASARAPKKVDF